MFVEKLLFCAFWFVKNIDMPHTAQNSAKLIKKFESNKSEGFHRFSFYVFCLIIFGIFIFPESEKVKILCFESFHSCFYVEQFF